MAQVRWDHLNRDASLLTKSQAIFLDGHFVIEHTARNRSGRFMHFNGTAGVWRRKTIEDAGGWEHDTLTEDLDLSYRAQMKGWNFLYLPQFCASRAPAGDDQLQAPGPPLDQGLYADGHQAYCREFCGKQLPRFAHQDRSILPPDQHAGLSADGHPDAFDVSHVLQLLRAVQGAQSSGAITSSAFSLFILATCSASTFFVFGQSELFGRGAGWKSLLYIPFLMGLGIGVSLNNTKAVFEAIWGAIQRKPSEFVRTPKYGVTGQDKTNWRPAKRAERSPA